MLIATLFLSASAFMPIYVEADNVKVYIDGEIIDFDVEPKIINGRTMVPMRKIFEYLGAEVNWNQYDKSIDAYCGYLNIEMQIDSYEMYINKEGITLDVAPVIDNGRTLVPLRAVADAFSSDVKWSGETRTVTITTKYPKNEQTAGEEFDKYHIRTSHGDFEFFDFLIKDDILTITGYINDASITNTAVTFDDKPLESITPVTAGKEFKLTVDLSKQNISGQASVNIWTQKTGEEMFWSYIHKILHIEKNGSDYSFQKPLVWENNSNFISAWVNPIGYINTDINEEIVNLSNEICKNTDNDYEKVLKIHDWVADNIYYNFDYLYNKTTDISYDALGVYKSKRSVCEGYANLTQALIHAQNIPCRKISGYSLGLGSALPYWTDEASQISDSNHAWNQAYVDNRWINIDTTWNSGNKYENGEFIYGGIQNHFYFDISNVFFSYNHKYIGHK